MWHGFSNDVDNAPIIAGTKREVLDRLAVGLGLDRWDLYLRDRSSSLGTDEQYEVLGPALGGERKLIGHIWYEPGPHPRIVRCAGAIFETREAAIAAGFVDAEQGRWQVAPGATDLVDGWIGLAEEEEEPRPGWEDRAVERAKREGVIPGRTEQ